MPALRYIVKKLCCFPRLACCHRVRSLGFLVLTMACITIACGVALDGDGNVIVAHGGNHCTSRLASPSGCSDYHSPSQLGFHPHAAPLHMARWSEPRSRVSMRRRRVSMRRRRVSMRRRMTTGLTTESCHHSSQHSPVIIPYIYMLHNNGSHHQSLFLTLTLTQSLKWDCHP